MKWELGVFLQYSLSFNLLVSTNWMLHYVHQIVANCVCVPFGASSNVKNLQIFLLFNNNVNWIPSGFGQNMLTEDPIVSVVAWNYNQKKKKSEIHVPTQFSKYYLKAFPTMLGIYNII